MADLLDLFFGSGPALKQKMTMGPEGALLQKDFRIEEYCNYDIDLWLTHKDSRMGEFDALLVNQELPLRVVVDIYRLENGQSRHLARLDKRPTLSGRGAATTTFNIGEMRLDKGSYHVKLETVGKPRKLEGAEAHFVVQIPPKTSCEARENT